MKIYMNRTGAFQIVRRAGEGKPRHPHSTEIPNESSDHGRTPVQQPRGRAGWLAGWLACELVCDEIQDFCAMTRFNRQAFFAESSCKIIVKKTVMIENDAVQQKFKLRAPRSVWG